MSEAELGEHRSGSGLAKVVNEILPQEPHRHGVEQERPLPRETDHAPIRVQLQEFLVMQILHSHWPLHQFEVTIPQFDRTDHRPAANY